MAHARVRTVFSTGSGRMCPTCGWPVDRCACSGRSTVDQPVPARIVAKLRIEKQGRGGKTVTVIYDLPRNQAFLKALCGELKHACGVGGTCAETSVEVQGNQVERVRALLAKKGWTVKG